MSDKGKKRTNNEISLIVPEVVPAFAATTDRGGGETHGIRSFVSDQIKHWTAKTVSEDALKQSLQRCMLQLKDLLKQAQQSTLDGWELEEIAVSLAISTEGTVGIATAGVESSIEATFKRTPKKP